MTKSQGKRWATRYRSKKEKFEERILGQWHGAAPRVDTERCISLASDHLEEILARLGIREGVDEQELIANWAGVVGEFISKHTRPVALKQGLLSIQVLQPAMRFHLEQSRGEILRKLKHCYGNEKIKNIRFVLG